MLVQRACNQRPQRAADENTGHVHGVQARTAVGIEGVHLTLAEHHVQLHGEIQQHRAHHQPDIAAARERSDQQRNRRQQQCDQRAATTMPGIGQTSGNRRGNGTHRTDQREDRDLCLSEAVVTHQFNRCKGPEQAETGKQQPLIQRALTQQWIAPGQGKHRTDQRSIRSFMRRQPTRQRHRSDQRDDRHQGRRAVKHPAPAEHFNQQARQWPRQQNTQQQTAHDIADDAATTGLGRQVCRQRHKDLHGHRGQTDE
ncbi:hypothetical protein D3C81_1167260 [compost metagenome]